MKKHVFFKAAAAAAIIGAAHAEPGVSDVSARQRYPWNGKVDVTCTVSDYHPLDPTCRFAVSAVDPDSGEVRAVSSVKLLRGGSESTDLTITGDGEYRLVWDAAADLGEVKRSNMVVRVTVKASPRKGQLWAGGPIWADKNVGAENPWDYGLYFWWGDTVGYKRSGSAWVASDGSSQNFSFGSGNTPTYGKSVSTLQSEGWVVSKNGTYVLAPAHDAAQVHWGGSWRMPTDGELSALSSNCDWTWTTTNGVSGYVVRGRGDYAASSIFLPAADYGYSTSLLGAGWRGYYWSSVPDESYSDYAWDLFFGSGYHDLDYYRYRYYGQSVRPVQGVAEIGFVAADSAPFALDTMQGARRAAATERLAYSTAWNAGVSGVSISVDGTAVFSAVAPDEGVFAWDAGAEPAGMHVLTLDDGVERFSATFISGKCALSVESPGEGCQPAAGTSEYDWGVSVTATAPEYFVSGLERRPCTGWTGTGSVPAAGTSRSVSFPLAEDSTLAWTAGDAEYRLELATEGRGSLSADSEWCQSGATKVVTASPAQYWHFERWEGDTAGCASRDRPCARR